MGLGTPASRARALFTTRVSELYSSALLSEVAKGGALALKGPAVIGLGSEEQCNVRATAVQPTPPSHPPVCKRLAAKQVLDMLVLNHARNDLYYKCPSWRKPPDPLHPYESKNSPSRRMAKLAIIGGKSVLEKIEYVITCFYILPKPSNLLAKIPYFKKYQQDAELKLEAALEAGLATFAPKDDDAPEEAGSRCAPANLGAPHPDPPRFSGEGGEEEWLRRHGQRDDSRGLPRLGLHVSPTASRLQVGAGS